MLEGAEAGLQTIVVVGAGQAGFQAAATLRDNGFQGHLYLIGDEQELPYERPPLSKGYLIGIHDRSVLNLRSESFFNQSAIEILTGRRVISIDRGQKQIHFANKSTLSYDHLVLATGSRNRPLALAGAEFEGVLQLRSVRDADNLRHRLRDLKTMVIIGAGFIGLELASVAISLGIEVTVLEASSRPLSRALSEAMSSFIRDAHRRAGVRFVFDMLPGQINGHLRRVTSVESADMQIFPAGLVVIGVGVIPNAELAAAAGLETSNGIVVDEQLVTSDPAISAIGDCAAFPHNLRGGARIRIESVQNAVDQARCAAARLTGRARSYNAVPWFWSHQGSLKLQIAGLSCPHDSSVIRGEPSSGAFSVFCFQSEQLVGVESMNQVADHLIARKLLSSRASLTPEEAADVRFDLKARANATPIAA